MSQFLQTAADLAAILAFAWAVYEFRWKRRTLVKAEAVIAPVQRPGEAKIGIGLYNASGDKPVTIKSICVEAKRWNSWTQCEATEKTTVAPFGDAVIRHDIRRLASRAMLAAAAGKTAADLPFATKISISLRTTSGETIPVFLDDFYKEELDRLLAKETGK